MYEDLVETEEELDRKSRLIINERQLQELREKEIARTGGKVYSFNRHSCDLPASHLFGEKDKFKCSCGRKYIHESGRWREYGLLRDFLTESPSFGRNKKLLLALICVILLVPITLSVLVNPNLILIYLFYFVAATFFMMVYDP